MMESLPPDPGVNTEVPYNRNRLPVPGTLYNTNTVESYNALDKPSLLRSAADKVFVIITGFGMIYCTLITNFLKRVIRGLR